MPYVPVADYAVLQEHSRNYSTLLEGNAALKERTKLEIEKAQSLYDAYTELNERTKNLEQELTEAQKKLEHSASEDQFNATIAQMHDQLNEAQSLNVLIRQEAKMYLQHLANQCATLTTAIQLAARIFEGEA